MGVREHLTELVHHKEGRNLSLFVLSVWALYLILSPFYIFPKGRPQPADFILAMGMIPVLATQLLNFKTKIKAPYIIGGLFVVLTVGINIANYLFFPDIRFLLTMLIYPYNFMVFLFIVWLFQKDLYLAQKVTFWAICVSVIIQLFVIQFADFGYRGLRGTAGFENPNQLAYWALLTASMVVFLCRGRALNALEWLLIFAITLLEALALSKSGIITYTVFLIILFFSPKTTSIGHLIALFVVILGLIYAINDPTTLNRVYDHIEPLKNVVARIQGIGEEADDSPEARGYFRIIENPYYTMVGSGEGAYYRFNPEGYNRELHSGIATIIFSYGILGALLFFGFLFLIKYQQPWHYILLFMPIILFGLPHQNFRFTHFWVLLGLNYGIFLAQYRNEVRKKLETMHEKASESLKEKGLIS